MTAPTYPADPALVASRLFQKWVGAHYARSTRIETTTPGGPVLQGSLSVGRQWTIDFAVANTLAPDADLTWEAARAAIEQRIDQSGRSLALWVPRGAVPPSAEPGLSQLMLSVESANPLEDGRLELRRPITLYLRRTSTTGSVMTILGGLQPSWAQFTNRVPGSFQLNSQELFRLPAAQAERDELIERIVLAAGQPEADESQELPAEDVWTATKLEDGGSCVLGTPRPENDEWSSALRRNLRTQLREAAAIFTRKAAARALVVLGASTYADEEKFSWALRGMDPSLYAGYDILLVITDGVIKPIMQPARGVLPWDAPLG